jgi:hypothetical protein
MLPAVSIRKSAVSYSAAFHPDYTTYKQADKNIITKKIFSCKGLPRSGNFTFTTKKNLTTPDLWSAYPNRHERNEANLHFFAFFMFLSSCFAQITLKIPVKSRLSKQKFVWFV